MATPFDFYAALNDLLDQVPEDQVTTPRQLSLAMGDPIATQAIEDALRREDYEEHIYKVVQSLGSGKAAFSDFVTDEPLNKLAETQRRMAEKVISIDTFYGITKIAGVDAAYYDDRAYCACVVLERDRAMECGTAVVDSSFPYIPGYLAFREAPAVISAARKVSGFDVLLVNGHGVAHPRGCGLATHVGLELDAPTIGVAGRRLVGEGKEDRGDWRLIVHRGRVVGAELPREEGSALYVSVGHLISLETSVEIVRSLMGKLGLPKPIAMAHARALDEKNHPR
ncbi:MAG: endonuclease V [Candidatus Bathyarchaeota archaeon]|nr:MAG: endonuclease V [Candidatus Bathyarchaeota archaeon]